MSSNLNLFTYGTLMVPEVFKKITGLLLPNQKAVLNGYDCYLLNKKTYPGIVLSKASETNGVLYFDVTPEIFRKLDLFEGDLYLREKVVVVGENNNTFDAFAYVLKPEAAKYLSQNRWSLENFISNHLNEFIQDDPGFTNNSRESSLK